MGRERFDYVAPPSLEQAAVLLEEQGAVLLAGGTDLLVKIARGAARPRLVVSLARVPGLDRIERIAGGLRIGARVVMARLAREPALGGAFLALREGAGSVGGPLVRNRATVAGNVVSARPCADTVPPMVALGARLLIAGRAGRRVVDLDGFVTGPGRTALAPGELIAAIELADLPRTGSAYLKLARRQAMEVTVVGCAARITLDETGRAVTRARVVLTSVAPVPLRTRSVEGILEGRAPEDEALDAAARAAAEESSPIDDHRAPAAYRREAAAALAGRALRLALERARAPREREVAA